MTPTIGGPEDTDDADEAKEEPGMFKDAGCQMCEPAPHPNCETYTEAIIVDPLEDESHIVPVCLDHWEAVRP